MADESDVQLFQKLHNQERQGLVPQRATLSETLATSTDARMRALTASANANNDVPFLLSLLSSSDAAVLEASADALWKLAIGAPARAAVHKANGARPLVALLSHPEQRVVRVAAGACSILALEQAQRTTILAAGGAAAIAAVLADGSDRAAEHVPRQITGRLVGFGVGPCRPGTDRSVSSRHGRDLSGARAHALDFCTVSVPKFYVWRRCQSLIVFFLRRNCR